MTRRSPSFRFETPRSARTIAASVTALGLFAAAGCNSSSSAEQTTAPAGTYLQKPDGDFFFAESSARGLASEVRVTRQYYGRLVDVVAFEDAALSRRRVIHRDFVVDPRSEGSWAPSDYALETNPVTGQQSLVIFRDFSDETIGGGREQFQGLLMAAESGAQPVVDAGFVGAGTFTMVPRNAAFVVVFDDLIDASTINQSSIRVLVGEPTIAPFEARMRADPNHGALADFDGEAGLEFYTTRIIVDPAISEVESFQADPPLTVNMLGYPPSSDVNFANVEVRLATRAVAGQQLPLLQNPTQHGLATTNGGTFDFGSATQDLVRAFRSGGHTGVTNDPSNGFLPDETPPELLGSLSAVITLPPQDAPLEDDPLVFLLPRIQFSSTTCAQSPRPGDLISQGALFAEVLNSSSVSSSGLARNVLVRLIAFPTNFTGPEQFLVSGAGPIQYVVPYVPGEDAGRAPCFVQISPPAPAANFPGLAIAPDATFAVRFSEPVDPGLFEPYESMRLLRSEPPFGAAAGIPANDFIPGAIRTDVGSQEFRFDPELPLAHVQGEIETYYLDFPAGAHAPRDLAGNAVLASLPAVELSVDPAAPSERTGGRVTRFQGADEEAPFGNPNAPNPIDTRPLPEWQGQLDYVLDRGRVRPRPVVRSRVVVSGDAEIPAAMTVGAGTALPLSPFGARSQIVWRYLDFGESLPLNEQNDITGDLDLLRLNIDVEGVWLSPLGGNAVFEFYPEFEMSMAHSAYLPDEVVSPTQQLLAPQSGLQPTFSTNLLDGANDPLQVVHARSRGLTIAPGERDVAPDGTSLIPLPMNRGVPESQKTYYTWRDTGLAARGGANGFGAPPARVAQISGVGPVNAAVVMGMEVCSLPGLANPFYPATEVRSAALPLLIDLRCYPTGGSASGNVFAHQLAHTSTLPGFRAYTAGGRNAAGDRIDVDPDSETVANGGFDPTAGGTGLPGVDNTLHFGALDLVVRVSRATSIYFPAIDPLDAGLVPFSSPEHFDPVVFPEIQPQGTRVEFSYRGATAVPDIARADAGRFDYYGDLYASWKPIDYVPPDEDLATELRNAASCFDGSFSYPVANPNPAITIPVPNNGIGFVGGDAWKSDVADLEGARFFQVRISMTSNAATGLRPEIAAIGFSWRQ